MCSSSNARLFATLKLGVHRMGSIFIIARPCFSVIGRSCRHPILMVRDLSRFALWLLFGVCAFSVSLPVYPQSSAACSSGTLYLTLDTGNMRHAELIAETLARHQVKASFFLANEKTTRGDFSLDAGWADFWKARVSEGHAFGSHTFDHVYFKPADPKDGDDALAKARPQFGFSANQAINWNAAQLCGELA